MAFVTMYWTISVQVLPCCDTFVENLAVTSSLVLCKFHILIHCNNSRPSVDFVFRIIRTQQAQIKDTG